MSDKCNLVTNKANPLFGMSYKKVIGHVKNNGYYITYAYPQTEELCKIAINQTTKAKQYLFTDVE